MNKEKGWTKLRDKINALQVVDEESKPTKEQIQRYVDLGYCNTEVGGKVAAGGNPDWYQLLRKTQGAEWFDEVYDNFQEHIIDGSGFIKDSLFCEHAYIINLDTMELEYWKGFQHKPQKGNRYGETAPTPSYKGQEAYYPCALMKTYPLKTISTKVKVKMIVDEMEKFNNEEE